MNKGFMLTPVLVVIVIVFLVSGIKVYQNTRGSKEVTLPVVIPMDTINNVPDVTFDKKVFSDFKSVPVQISDIKSEEILTHEQEPLPGINEDILFKNTDMVIDQSVATPEEAIPAEQEIVPKEKNDTLFKDTGINQSNCQSNPSPIFTNDITDVSKINYIGPPPTMGAGPSLKTHGYIGTDHARVPVYSPTVMTLESGSYFVGGPYLLEFRASCEVRVRFGHITEPVEAIKKLLPNEPKQDSRTEGLPPIVFVAGELIGYTTGTDRAGNWDFGVYNSTIQNRYIDDPAWNNSTTYTTAVCPFDYFSENLRSVYFSKFDLSSMGGNPPHGESFCR